MTFMMSIINVNKSTWKAIDRTSMMMMSLPTIRFHTLPRLTANKIQRTSWVWYSMPIILAQSPKTEERVAVSLMPAL